MAVANYQKLIVWQKSMELTTLIYMLTKRLPKEEIYALSNQMRRAVVSIPSNIAEGNGRQKNGELMHFLRIAKGSAAELETQLLICENLQYLSKDETSKAMALLTEISKMLRALLKDKESSN